MFLIVGDKVKISRQYVPFNDTSAYLKNNEIVGVVKEVSNVGIVDVFFEMPELNRDIIINFYNYQLEKVK